MGQSRRLFYVSFVTTALYCTMLLYYEYRQTGIDGVFGNRMLLCVVLGAALQLVSISML